MLKLTLLRGLPASGKSTLAETMVGPGTVRINRDLLREMLHFSVWSGKNEDRTIVAAESIAEEMLRRGVNVVIDDTNLSERTVGNWACISRGEFPGVKVGFEIIDVDTSVEECLRRDALREKPVGQSIIVGMALQYGWYPIPPRGFVLCDIDGTLADITHRLHYIKDKGKKDWDSFFADAMFDSPRYDTINMVREWIDATGRELILVSGRPEVYRKHTEEWLAKHVQLPFRALFMRKAGDRRDDIIVKQEILNRYFPDKSVIHCVIDDRPRVIRMWRENGLEVIDVGEGVEF